MTAVAGACCWGCKASPCKNKQSVASKQNESKQNYELHKSIKQQNIYIKIIVK
ncbi:MAG: hypothetical protein [Microvirus sp.]|nr:MAG: hypothetical protein [Microvirus sp.]